MVFVCSLKVDEDVAAGAGDTALGTMGDCEAAGDIGRKEPGRFPPAGRGPAPRYPRAVSLLLIRKPRPT